MLCFSPKGKKIEHKVVESKNSQSCKESRQEIELISLVGTEREKDEKTAKKRVEGITGGMGNTQGGTDSSQFTAVNKRNCWGKGQDIKSQDNE